MPQRNASPSSSFSAVAKQRVKEVMSTDVVSVHPHDTVHEALELILENRVSAVPVTDRRGRCIGILSVTDLIGLAHDVDDDVAQWDALSASPRGGLSQHWLISRLRETFSGQRVDELMTDAPAVIGPELPVTSAIREMVRQRVHRLPVVNGDQRLIGIVSTMDVLAALAEAAETS